MIAGRSIKEDETAFSEFEALLFAKTNSWNVRLLPNPVGAHLKQLPSFSCDFKTKARLDYQSLTRSSVSSQGGIKGLFETTTILHYEIYV